jgi:hypothetical protein
MKITYLLAALLLVPTFAMQATAHVRPTRRSHRVYVKTCQPVCRQTLFGTCIERNQGMQLQSQPQPPKDDWPNNMILGSFRSHAESHAEQMAERYAI